jgi:pyridoxine 5-phosphate synthase
MHAAAAQAALDAGLGINAGHDLNRDNLPAFVARVPGLAEVSIGHALIADALELGYAETAGYQPASMPAWRTGPEDEASRWRFVACV